MSHPILDSWASVEKPVIGMLHARPLPGASSYGGDREAVRSALLRDADALAEGGVDGFLLENFGDSPFYPRRVPAYTAAHLTALAAEIRRRFKLPLGINVLRNDGQTALAVAHAVDAQFIRVNVLSGARLTDQGLVEGIAHDLMRDRAWLRAEMIKVLADVNVKHSAPVALISPGEEVRDLVKRAGAEGLIVTGSATAQAVDVGELKTVRAAATDVPVFVGSGVTAESIESYRALADGFIVGSFFKFDGETHNPVDPARVRLLMDRLR